ncbi:MAG: hypothetical protein ISS46_03910, partial [Candidatus Omnitrophica bacterium]|nr:hypothetical protein [Candidatus Omnitrophota bacterium]
STKTTVEEDEDDDAAVDSFDNSTSLLRANVDTTRYYDYAYITGLDESTTSDSIAADRGADDTLDADSNHKDAGVNVLYVDGHVSWIPGSTLVDTSLID